MLQNAMSTLDNLLSVKVAPSTLILKKPDGGEISFDLFENICKGLAEMAHLLSWDSLQEDSQVWRGG